MESSDPRQEGAYKNFGDANILNSRPGIGTANARNLRDQRAGQLARRNADRESGFLKWHPTMPPLTWERGPLGFGFNLIAGPIDYVRGNKPAMTLNMDTMIEELLLWRRQCLG